MLDGEGSYGTESISDTSESISEGHVIDDELTPKTKGRNGPMQLKSSLNQFF